MANSAPAPIIFNTSRRLTFNESFVSFFPVLFIVMPPWSNLPTASLPDIKN
jgi:hypothetical protein